MDSANLIITDSTIEEDLKDAKKVYISSLGFVTFFVPITIVAFKKLTTVEDNATFLQYVSLFGMIMLGSKSTRDLGLDIIKYKYIIKYIKGIQYILNNDISIDMGIKEQLCGVSDDIARKINYNATIKNRLLYINNLDDSDISLDDVQIIAENVSKAYLEDNQKILRNKLKRS
jgi:hypothetical protein